MTLSRTAELERSTTPAVVRDRPWLVSDSLVLARLAGHPVLPTRDVGLQRNARAVAFALGLLALPAAGSGSIADVDLALDAAALGERLALGPGAIEEAFRILWVADVLRHAPTPGLARLATELVPPSPLAFAVRWSVVAARLLDRSGEGSLAAVVLFRLLLDRLSHPHAPATLPASVVTGQLGLGDDQARRGMRALLQRELVVEQGSAGRAKQYLLGGAVLVGVPGAPVVPLAMSLVRPPEGVEAPVAAAAPLPGPSAPPAPPTAPAAAQGRAGAILEFAGQRIELPAQTELSVAVPGTRLAGMRVDPASGRLVFTLESASGG